MESLVDRWQRLGREMSDTLRRGEPSDVTIRQWVAAIGRLQVGAFMRLAIASNEDQDRDERARRFFDGTGHWPGEA